MLKSIVFFSLLIISVSGFAHPWKSDNYVIIDTDCGMDDLRAITLMLSSPTVRVLAIISSNGVLSAEQGNLKIKSLLHEFHHEGILTGINPSKGEPSKNCETAIAYIWGSAETTQELTSFTATDLVDTILKNTKEKITFISLASLNTLGICLSQCEGFKERLKKNVWSGSNNLGKDNFNYQLDTISAKKIIAAKIPLELICCDMPEINYNSELLKQIGIVENKYSRVFINSVQKPVNNYSKLCFDEQAALYLHYPNLFRTDTSSAPTRCCFEINICAKNLGYYLNTILAGETNTRNQVMKNIPNDTISYQSDIQEIMINSIQKFGKVEWDACVMANELHKHLGTYAVIGTKMGLKAREYYGAGIDEMKIISYAGSIPPYSCMNDGLQVSTGATLGHGLIRIASDAQKLPQADFTYMGRTIRLSLKEIYWKKIESEIMELNIINGLDSDIYWQLVRQSAIRYWSGWDRHEIFELSTINK